MGWSKCFAMATWSAMVVCVSGVWGDTSADNLPSSPSEYFLACGTDMKACAKELGFPDSDVVRSMERRCTAQKKRQWSALEQLDGSNKLSANARDLFILSSLVPYSVFQRYDLGELGARLKGIIATKKGLRSKEFEERYNEKMGALYAVFKRLVRAVPKEAYCDDYFEAVGRVAVVGEILAWDFYRDGKSDWKEVKLETFVPSSELLARQGTKVTLEEAKRLSKGHTILYIRDGVHTGIKVGMMQEAALAQLNGYRVSYLLGDNSEFPAAVEGKHAVVLYDGKVGGNPKLQFVYDLEDEKHKVAGTLMGVEKKLRGGPVEAEVFPLKSGWWPFQ